MSIDRRTVLQILGAGATVGTSGCVSLFFSGGGSNSQQGGSLLSFGTRRKRIKKADADTIANGADALITAARQPDTTVWIPEDTAIDLSGQRSTTVAPNVTIASGRNLGGQKGGRITFNTYATAFVVPNGSARLTGVRFRGPQQQYRNFSSERATYANAASGIHFMGTSAVVDNCEIFGWPGYGVGIGGENAPTQGWVHHNNIHHCQMGGLGYPVELFNGFSLIEWNSFSHYRHVVAGYGQMTNGYEARCNIVGNPAPDVAAFAFDMHKLGEQDNYPSGISTAGRWINVHHNVCDFTAENALSISGIPTQFARFANNWCAHSEDAAYAPDNADLRTSDNQYGANTVKKGKQWLKKFSRRNSLSSSKPSKQAWSPTENTATTTKTSSTTPTPTNTPK